MNRKYQSLLIIVLGLLLVFINLVSAVSQSVSVNVVETTDLQLYFVPINNAEFLEIDNENFVDSPVGRNVEFLESIFPIRNNGVSVVLDGDPIQAKVSNPSWFDRRKIRVDILNRVFLSGRGFTNAIGIVEAGYLSNIDATGINFDTGTADVLLIDETQIKTLSHEVGHTLGLCDEYDEDVWNRQDKPFDRCPNGDLDGDGSLDPICSFLGDGCPAETFPELFDYNPYSLSLRNFMGDSDTPDLDDSPPSGFETWISEQSFNVLLDELKTGSPVITFYEYTSPYMVIRMSYEKNGSFEILGSYRLESGFINNASVSEGNFSFELLDNEDNVISNISFEPNFNVSTENGTIIELNKTFVIFALPIANNISKIQFRNISAVLKEVNKTPNTPTLSITTNLSGQVFTNQSFNVSWNSSDLDGDTIVYAILYSADNGSNYTALEIDYNQTNITLNPLNLPNCALCRIKILATDGFNTNFSVSAAFLIDNTGPVANETIIINESGTIDGNVTLLDNITINVTIIDEVSEVDSVWIKIWQGAIGISTVIWQGFLSFVSGDLWSVEIETNESFSLGENNYTIYANDTLGNEVNVSGNFNITQTPNINFISPPTPTSGDMIFEFNDDFIVNVNTSNADSVTVRLYNASRVLINSTTSTSSNFVVNYSSLNLSSGVYFFNATAINSISETNSTHTRNIVYGNPFNFSNGIVTGSYKINVNESGFGNGNELSGDYFGVSLASLGDLDGDGVIDIAVGEYRNDDGGLSNGAFWIMFMNSNGTVKSSYKINESRFGNGNELSGDYFGISLANIGDLDGDGVVDLAVGDYANDDGGTSNGAVWIMFMNRNGSVKSSYKINESRFGNSNELDGDYFGRAIANIGDLDGDGVVDLAVGEYANDDGGTSNGAVWIMFMNTNGSVKSSYKINESSVGNGSELSGDFFGGSLASLGDLDGDGVTDLAVGEYLNDDGGLSNGAFWIMFMNTNGSVKSSYKINESRFGNGDELEGSSFGISLTSLGDLDGDSIVDIAVGEYNNDDGGLSNGAFWVMFMNSNGTVKSSYKINEARFGNGDELSGDSFGIALAALGDLDGDGVIDLAVGEYRSDDGGSQNGAFWIMNFERPIIFNISILYPTGNISVTQNTFFNVSVNITCIQGNCEIINVTLDPERVGEDGELLDKRTYNQKVFTAGQWKERYQIHTGQIHYKDKNNGDEFAEIDTRLVSSSSGWVMDKASYSVNIPEYSDGNFIFTNEYEEAQEDVVGMTPAVVNRVRGVLSSNNSVVYKDAFGTNIDLKVIARRNGFDKLVVLNEKPTDLSNDLEFEFELDLKEFDITTDGAEWNKANKVTVRSDIVLRGHGDTIFREFRMWDSDGNSVPITVRLEKKRGKYYFVKILDKEFLEKAVYPVQTDDTETYYFGNGDGYVYNSDTTWSNTRSAASGLGYDYTGTIGYTYNLGDSVGSSYQIYRSFIPIDTSGIPENVAIDSATLNLYGYTKNNDFNLDFHVVQTTQMSTSSLSSSDFSEVGSTSGGFMSISSFTANAWNVITLDSTGIGWIDSLGWTKLGLRDYQDIYDSNAGDGQSDVEWYTSEDMNAPYLEVQTTLTAKGIIPVGSGDPFYTNNSNPRMTASLNEGESEVIRYWVKATGTTGYSYTFFALANKTDYLSNGVMSNTWNVSIV